jgi:hypothetical protein
MLGVAYRIKEFLLLVLATFLIVVQFRPSFFSRFFLLFIFVLNSTFFLPVGTKPLRASTSTAMACNQTYGSRWGRPGSAVSPRCDHVLYKGGSGGGGANNKPA